MERDVKIAVDHVTLEGALSLPPQPRGMVIFAHGSGSSRHSPRNMLVARLLREAGLATLLFDLLTRSEDLNHENRFDIPLLARRLVATTRWFLALPETAGVPVAYFGASTGAAAALIAAAELGGQVRGVVSRGGRPDLALPCLQRVTVPVLLIVGERDTDVLRLNRQAYAELPAEKRLEIVAGATHLFEEPGTLEQAAALARDWFLAVFSAGQP